jgi:tRNA A-37 threonylcarbamoyl transferase component Bud32
MSSRAQAPPESRRPPRLPERYRLRRHIASGGMAAVWCAEDLVLDRNVAIKILAERFAHDQVAVRRFKREARAAARVATHPHVVTIYDVGDLEPDDGDGDEARRAFLVMEYLAGGTVADAIRVRAVRRHEALRWISEAASALDHAHARGIVHRDIKPANFLLDRSRVLHVADFGIARLVSEDTITSSDQLFGTAAYLSPEQALGRAATSASDRYALAVAAFELLAGERPFTAPHFAAQARQHIEDEPPLASARDRSLPPAVDEVLVRGMAKQADARFATAGDFVEALRRSLVSAPPSVRALPRRDGRRPAPITVAPAGRTAGTRTATAVRTTMSTPQVRRHGRRVIALTALLVAVVGIAAVGLATLGGGAHRSASARADRSPAASAGAGTSTNGSKRAGGSRSGTATSRSAAGSTGEPTAQQLQLTGHQEMLAGNYQTAIPTLRQAVSSSAPGSVTYAYALYDLGRSLMLGGDPTSAVRVLQQRLKIPNQTAVVQQLLDQAERAAGQAPESATESTTTPATPTTPTAPATPAPPSGDHGPGHSDGHGRGFQHGGPTGGAGLAPPTPGHGNGHGPGVQGNLVD